MKIASPVAHMQNNEGMEMMDVTSATVLVRNHPRVNAPLPPGHNLCKHFHQNKDSSIHEI